MNFIKKMDGHIVAYYIIITVCHVDSMKVTFVVIYFMQLKRTAH